MTRKQGGAAKATKKTATPRAAKAPAARESKLPKFLREATEDEERVALLRVFAAFEDDFRMALAQMLHRACVRLRPANGAVPPVEEDLKHLPTMQHCMPLASSYEPGVSMLDRIALEKLRAFRNTVMHQGFAEKSVDDVDDVATFCARVVGVFSEGLRRGAEAPLSSQSPTTYRASWPTSRSSTVPVGSRSGIARISFGFTRSR